MLNHFPTNAIWCIKVSLGLPLSILSGLFVSYNWLVFVCWLWFLKSAEMGFPLPPVTYYFVCSLFLLRGRGEREGRRKMDLKSLWLADNWAPLTGAEVGCLVIGYLCLVLFTADLDQSRDFWSKVLEINPVSADANEFYLIAISKCRRKKSSLSVLEPKAVNLKLSFEVWDFSVFILFLIGSQNR